MNELMLNTQQAVPDAGDYARLRARGLELLQQMSGDTWTDYNLHDPGVTILEQLCYAITDLAYRTSFPIADLLANEKGKIDNLKNSFYEKKDILSSNPSTENDYRKILIDSVDEIDNVWIYKFFSYRADYPLKGLYKLYIQPSLDIASRLPDTALADAVKVRARACFVANRNLCEDIAGDVVLLEPQKVVVKAAITVTGSILPEIILAEIVHAIERTLIRPVPRFTEKELLATKKTPDQIYLGPMLENGFIPDEVLEDRKSYVDPLELVRVISDLESVVSVVNLTVDGEGSEPVQIGDLNFPILDLEKSRPGIRIFINDYEIQVPVNLFKGQLYNIREKASRLFVGIVSKEQEEAVYTPRASKKYYSIQQNFPVIYGLGQEGGPDIKTEFQKAQVKQLKAYLMLFEQLMTDYLAQLGSLDFLFSNESDTVSGHTYFNQPLYDVPGAAAILMGTDDDAGWETFKADENNPYRRALREMVETDEVFAKRRELMLDHLLARFNEMLVSFPVKIYSDLYTTTEEDPSQNIIRWKSTILRNIDKQGYNRCAAQNYLSEKIDLTQYDFAKRMRELLFIGSDPNIRLTGALSQLERSEPEQEATGAENLAGQRVEKPYSPEYTMNITLNREEMIRMIDHGELVYTAAPDDQFNFYAESSSLFYDGINKNNYRIGIDPGQDDDAHCLLLYKKPEDDRWTVVSSFESFDTAARGLKSIIDLLRQISKQSEGFYLIEHILLRPSVDSPNFGFRFYDSEGKVRMRNREWVPFKQRERILSDITENTTNLRDFCHMVDDNGRDYTPGAYGELPQDVFPGLEMVVQGPDGEPLPEDFFSFRLSVILPAWPARFQDPNFLECVKSLFRLNAPAHIKLHFCYLDIEEMEVFETLYDDYLIMLRGKRGDSFSPMTAFIYNCLGFSNK